MKLLAIIVVIAVTVGVMIAINLNNDSDVKIVAGNNTIGELSIRGSAEKSIKPDMVSLSVGVTTTNSSAKDVVDENASKMNKIIDILKANDINNDEITTSYYNLYPVYTKSDVCIEIYPPQNDCNTIVEFRVSNTLTITTTTDKDVGELIDLIVEAGATNIHGVNFFVSKTLSDDVKNRLIEEAIINAKERGELAIKPLNMSIIGVKSINIDSVNIPFGVTYEATRATPILPSEQNIRVDVNIVFYIS